MCKLLLDSAAKVINHDLLSFQSVKKAFFHHSHILVMYKIMNDQYIRLKTSEHKKKKTIKNFHNSNFECQPWNPSNFYKSPNYLAWKCEGRKIAQNN